MSSSISLPRQQIPFWMKNLLAGGAVFFCCWGGVLAYWRMQRSAPAAGEIVFYLLAVPVALLLLFWSGGKLMASVASAPAKRHKARPGSPNSLTAQAPPLAILAASLRSPHGASVDELAAAIAAGKAYAGLDRELIGEHGDPVMTARCLDAGDDLLREEISAWLPHHGMPTLQFSEEQWRALTLASAITSDLVMRATDELVTTDGGAPMLQLMPLLPADWPPGHRRAVGMWLRHTAAQFGWPFDRIALAADAAVAADATPAAAFARLARAAGQPAPALTLVLACASHIGQQSVDDWAAKGILFSAAHAQGAIPREGAAGLLVANLAQARSIESMAYVLLDRFEETRLPAPAGDAGRADAAPLGKLAQAACRHAGIAAPDISMVIGDAGQRTPELMELVAAATPQLDMAGDVVQVGPACGSCGAVPFLAGLALARYYTLDSEAPTLFTSNADPTWRCAAVVRSALSLPLS